MRVFSLLLLCLVSVPAMVLAQGSADALHLAGGGVFVATRPYDGAKTRTMPVPVIVVDHKGFYSVFSTKVPGSSVLSERRALWGTVLRTALS
jgi:outer membrane scaffolding protein for murein synthesis (MipA/OmpV family)